MTVPISPESPRRIEARRFALTLRRVMHRDGVSGRRLADDAGLGRGRVGMWLMGRNLPTLEVAARLADALEEPELLACVVRSRTVVCVVCGRSVVNRGTGPRRYCGAACAARTNRDRQGKPARERAAMAERSLAVATFAIEAFCRGCEPEGLCRDTTCSLRPVSPLPVDLRRATA